MLGYVFILLGAYTTYAYWGSNMMLTVTTAALTVIVGATQYIIKAKNRDGNTNDDKNYVLANMVTSVIVFGLFVASFFLVK